MRAQSQRWHRGTQRPAWSVGQFRVLVVVAALALAFVVVLLPLTGRRDFVSDVVSMAILIGALTFARFLDRRSGAVVALLAGAIAATVPGVPSFPPRSLWEGALRLGAFATMTVVYYGVIVTLRGHDEHARRQLEGLRALHHAVRALHTLTTASAVTRETIYVHVARAATDLSGGGSGRLFRADPEARQWQIVAQWPAPTVPGEGLRTVPMPLGHTGLPYTICDDTCGSRITVPITTEHDGTLALEVAYHDDHKGPDERAELLAVYARDVHLTLEHLALQEQLAHLMLAEERGRIARELHDGLVQSLGGIAYRLEYFGNILSGDTVASVRRELGASAVAVRKALREARLMIHGLRDAGQADDVCARLTALLDDVADETAMAIVVDLPSVAPILMPAQADAIYRVAQEALQNAVKHSEAESVSVALLVEPDRIELTVADDGHGFADCVDDSRAPPLRYGLLGMTERAARHGGRVTIQTQPEMGTCVTLTLPIQEKAG